MKNILIGITSSISAYKIYELVRMYKKNDFEVKIVLTPNAKHFVSELVLQTLSQNKVYCEQFEKRDDVEHISLVDWADCFILAPATANTISQCANGLAPNLLTSIFCAFLGSKKPILIAPAMNCDMWNNLIIQENIEKLKSVNVYFQEPEKGFLACGVQGVGRLAKIENIFESSLRLLYSKEKNLNKKIIITLGGTKEKIDNVRYITNASSGKMGIALANWAYRLGFNVIALSTFEFSAPYEVVVAKSAQDMLEELKRQKFDYLVMASAIADYKVENPSNVKLSKEEIGDKLELKLVKNPDVVSEISAIKTSEQKIIGFCLADKDIVETAKIKLNNKKLDFIVANDVKIALNTSSNAVTIINKNGTIIDIEQDSKENIAKKILEVVCD